MVRADCTIAVRGTAAESKHVYDIDRSVYYVQCVRNFDNFFITAVKTAATV